MLYWLTDSFASSARADDPALGIREQGVTDREAFGEAPEYLLRVMSHRSDPDAFGLGGIEHSTDSVPRSAPRGPKSGLGAADPGFVEGSPLVFVLLCVAFAAVGVHLVVYARRRAAVLRRFAQSRGLRFEARDDGSLEHQLSRDFGIEDHGCARAFGQIRDIVSLPQGKVFRTVEQSDLSPHASGEYSHHARAAVLFPGHPAWSSIFHITADLAVHQRYPRERGAADVGIRRLFEQAEVAAPPHPLSLTFMRGWGLAYLEPVVTGSVTEAHLTYLADLAARLSSALADTPSRGTARGGASPQNAGAA